MDIKTQASTLRTPKEVAARFKGAAATARRLPSAEVQGYFNSWPKIIRESWETLTLEKSPKSFPPDPKAIDHMMETMRWLQWIEQPERHLVLGFSMGVPRENMANERGISRSTLWRRYKAALTEITTKLNDAGK
jgi:uncharacterized protein YqcC (DUF446 family)